MDYAYAQLLDHLTQNDGERLENSDKKVNSLSKQEDVDCFNKEFVDKWTHDQSIWQECYIIIDAGISVLSPTIG